MSRKQRLRVFFKKLKRWIRHPIKSLIALWVSWQIRRSYEESQIQPDHQNQIGGLNNRPASNTSIRDVDFIQDDSKFNEQFFAALGSLLFAILSIATAFFALRGQAPWIALVFPTGLSFGLAVRATIDSWLIGRRLSKAHEREIARESQRAKPVTVHGLEGDCSDQIFDDIDGLISPRRLTSSQKLTAKALANNSFVELRTGEGKSLAIAAAAAMLARGGRRVHIVTQNEYLSQRDYDEARRLLRSLGIDVVCLEDRFSPERRRLYERFDVMYCSGASLGFAYLEARRNGFDPVMDAAIFDEADYLLVDDCLNPIVFASPDSETRAHAKWALRLSEHLVSGVHYRLEGKRVVFGPAIDKLLLSDRVSADFPRLARHNTAGGTDRLNMEIKRDLRAALIVKYFYRRDRDYRVIDGRVEIIDQDLGRVQPGRKWAGGIQQAVEAREGLEISPLTEAFSRTSLYALARKYNILSGTSGTIEGAESLLLDLYGRYSWRARPNHPDMTEEILRFAANPDVRDDQLFGDVVNLNGRGRPILIVCPSIAEASRIHGLLAGRGIDAYLWTASTVDLSEEQIIAAAGLRSAVTVATTIAARGVNIVPAEATSEGMAVLNLVSDVGGRTERQIRGRASRFGRPGSYYVYYQLRDSLFDGESEAVRRHILRKRSELSVALLRSKREEAVQTSKRALALVENVLEERMDMCYRSRVTSPLNADEAFNLVQGMSDHTPYARHFVRSEVLTRSANAGDLVHSSGRPRPQMIKPWLDQSQIATLVNELTARARYEYDERRPSMMNPFNWSEKNWRIRREAGSVARSAAQEIMDRVTSAAASARVENVSDLVVSALERYVADVSEMMSTLRVELEGREGAFRTLQGSPIWEGLRQGRASAVEGLNEVALDMFGLYLRIESGMYADAVEKVRSTVESDIMNAWADSLGSEDGSDVIEAHWKQLSD